MIGDNPVFQRVMIDNIIAGGARISWVINRHFVDSGTYTFQLQVGQTGLAEADDWTDIGAPTDDVDFLIDTDKRVWGKTLDTHYRVVLTTGSGTYYSDPEQTDGHLGKRDWLTAREIVRKETLRHRALVSPNGYLLKVRRYGPVCPNCLDENTGEVSLSQCPVCYGTGFAFGYFEPLPATYADTGLGQAREHRNPSKGMESTQVISARFIGDPQLYSYDVWVDSTSDQRFYFHTVKIESQVRNVPIIYTVELRLAPFSDVIYTVPIREDAGITPNPLPQLEKKTWKPRVGLNYLESLIAKAKTRSSKQ